MKKVKNSDLKAKDARIASLTISDQIHLLDRVSVARHLPSDVLLLLVIEDGDCDLYARGPKVSVENARYFAASRCAMPAGRNGTEINRGCGFRCSCSGISETLENTAHIPGKCIHY